MGTCDCEACKNPEKYPLKSELLSKDPNFKDFEKSVKLLDILFSRDMKTTKEHFKSFCCYIDDHDAEDYPSMEISECTSMIQTCVKAFSKDEDFKVWDDVAEIFEINNWPSDPTEEQIMEFAQNLGNVIAEKSSEH